jgi:hypothetical protein
MSLWAHATMPNSRHTAAAFRTDCTRPQQHRTPHPAARFLQIASAFFLAAAPLYASNPFPDWVRTAAHQTLPTYPETTKAVVLLEETTYTVAIDGKATEHVRRVVKILRPQGRRYAYPFVWFDKDSKVNYLHVWSIDPAGHEYTLKDSDIQEIGQPGEGGQLYSDERAKVADPPGRDPGGIVAYEYEKRERPYLAETNWMFQDGIPHLTQNFTLILPPTFTYTTTWAHHDKIDGADLENHSYRWEMNNEPAIDLENVPMSPSTESLAARMAIHYTGAGMTAPQDGTWQGIGQWYDVLSRDRLVATPDIAAKAAELTQGKTDFYDKAEAIGEFVQKQIRYFVIEMGVGGYQPHPADDIFRGRYGDCKDKATLLSAMLSSVGIHSALMMVDTSRGVVNPDAPSIMGNHMIGAIEIPTGYDSPKLRSVVTAKTGKRYLIFDPTWEETPFGQLEYNLQGSYGVLIEGANSQAIQLPILSPDLNTLRRTATFQLGADGSLQGTVTEKRFGDLAARRRAMFNHTDAKQQQQYMDRIAAHDFASVSLTDLKVENVDALNKDITTSFAISASHFATVAGPLIMVRPRVIGSLAPDVDHKKRKVDVDLEQTMQATDTYDIAIPSGYVVDELPDPVKVDMGFASYESSTVLQGQTLHYERRYTQRQVTLAANRYSELQHLASLIEADEQGRAVLKRSQ